MSASSEDALKEPDSEFHDGCEPVECPNPKCNQVFLDLDEDFLDETAEIECRKCKRLAKCIGSMQDVQRPSKSIYVFKCDPCKVKFTRKIPAMKRYCPSCKTHYRMFWHLLLKLPSYSSNRMLEKVA